MQGCKKNPLQTQLIAQATQSKQFKFDLILNFESANEEDKHYNFSNNFQLHYFPFS